MTLLSDYSPSPFAAETVPFVSGCPENLHPPSFRWIGGYSILSI